ncbi:hypothetical protein [Clostridium scatologenes]|uniref:Uncharacterized protein n=1 Tax=Clostridium scatologenes TaxID=1548 RepID=A0A0E3K089_CLOSL|nr:hypothetical protein [Clostridium scatologenes]AKA69812.1 hypothetical protein CSCA_2687 [Clostridium scatologenes]
MINEDEKLFETLSLFHIDSNHYTNQLIKEGYLDKGLGHTKKADEFIKRFYDEKKDIVFSMIKEHKLYFGFREKIKESTKIKSTDALDKIAYMLHEEGKLIVEKDNIFPNCIDYKVK